MADFKIGRLRYTWRGNWVTSKAYNKDDVVRFGANTWVCVRQHTSSAFQDDLDFTYPGYTEASPAWIVMTEGYGWRDDWTGGTLYSPGDVINYGGTLYICTDSHTASDFEAEVANWAVYMESIGWKGDWTTSTAYGSGDIVKYNGIVYKCVTEHTSSDLTNGLEANQADWTVYHSGIQYRGSWATETRYRENDLVKYGGTIFRCTTGHTSSGEALEDANFSIELYGSEFDGEWASGTYYNTGDIVKHGGYVYYASRNNVNRDPGEYFSDDGSSDWVILANGVNPRGDWDSAGFYKTGDVVRRGGVLYIAKRNVYGDGSTLGYLNAADWEIVVDGDDWKNFWEEGVSYNYGDVVLFDGSAYFCTYAHLSETANFPGDNGEGYDYWDLLLLSADQTGFTAQGDLLTYGLTRRLTGDGSSIGITNVPVGDPGEYLAVQSETELGYENFGNEQRVFYVATNGVDDDFDETRGINEYKPFRTVRYACEKANDGYDGGTTVKVASGYYEEVLPIIVPPKTSVVGMETRAVRIVPKGPNPALANDFTYTISAINKISGIIPTLLSNFTVTPTPGNNEEQVAVTETQYALDEFGEPYLGPDGEEYAIETVTLTGSPESIISIQNLASEIIQYINYHIGGTGTDPSVSGSNDITTDQGYLNAAKIILANKHFLAAEAVAWIANQFASYDFDSDSCARDMRRYVEAWAYDIQYTGNYKSLLAARYYRNAVNGSATEDMFYFRNATGIKQVTLDGLEGTLNPPNVFDLYRRPTGGAYASLDPGWGPDDESVWIHTRSPYLQNSAIFGYACTSMLIDGSVHNGGYKSMVANDYTSLISDGIGAYVLNNGRAELVSIFTYYCTVGYLAELGGVIRATNGNNSYGRFGALASGIDPTETPRYGAVDNRRGEATVAAAFAGEVNDEILILEYENCGQAYTQATASFVGSGVNAEVVFDDFRDDAIYDVRLIDPPDSGSAGGGGFTFVGNNCQAGDLTTITLATNDEGEEPEYLGLRIIITSGTGTGQYGYVGAYDSLTKVLDVYRESDGQPGWDHVTPGWPLALILDTSSTYRLEPRPVFTPPNFSSGVVDLTVGTNWEKIVYGEKYQTFNSVAATLGTGDVEEQDGLVATAARFNVVKDGRNYSITMINAGAGYADQDVLTIAGTDLGGVSPDNDITVTITAVSDDSTNSIVSYSYEGIGASGLFVAVPSIGATLAYSENGADWNIGTLPTSGNWKCLAAGASGFVAIRNDSNKAASSNDGVTWTTRTMPVSTTWNSVAYGDGVYVAISGAADIGAFSTNKGVTWSTTTLPDLGDSTFNEWVSITYGKGKFVAIANSNNIAAVGEWNGSSITWTATIMDVIADSSQKDWVKVTYGNGRFFAISSTGDGAYSFDGILWYPATMPTPDGSTIMHWSDVGHGQGVFLAVCDTDGQVIAGDPTSGPTTYVATSPDGIVWTSRTVSTERNWHRVAFGNPDTNYGDSTVSSSTGTWVALPSETSQYGERIFTGATLTGRCIVETGRVTAIRIWDPGSGYVNNTPELIIVDPNNTSEVYIDPRKGYGVLSQPGWVNRGVGYKTSTTTVTISGNGFSDVIPVGDNVTLEGLSRYPNPGAQLRFTGNDEVYTVVTITELGQADDGTYAARFRVDPKLEIIDNLEHSTQVEIRERYSQIRITGHDFLDVGTGNFEETNYPELYSQLYVNAPEDEIYEYGGGRCFYTSTDQNGNFRCGELFAVEQATGIVTISADFFQLDGLTELALGGVRLGGSGAVIREFSTDPLFTEDSNNIVPTQRAIKAYLANRLSVGGSELTTASFIAGVIKVGPQEISSTISGLIRVVGHTDFSNDDTYLDGAGSVTGVDGSGEVSGMMVAQNMFHASFGDDPNRLS